MRVLHDATALRSGAGSCNWDARCRQIGINRCHKWPTDIGTLTIPTRLPLKMNPASDCPILVVGYVYTNDTGSERYSAATVCRNSLLQQSAATVCRNSLLQQYAATVCCNRYDRWNRPTVMGLADMPVGGCTELVINGNQCPELQRLVRNH